MWFLRNIIVCVWHRVDVHMPGIEVVGGYSMTSPPEQLEDPLKGTLELAIKSSSHLPTEWMTNKVSTTKRRHGHRRKFIWLDVLAVNLSMQRFFIYFLSLYYNMYWYCGNA